MEPRNERLWKLAKQRAQFKKGLITYLIVNTGLIGIWYFTPSNRNFFWPIFPLFFWGIGLGINYYQAYISNGDAVEDEYQKLLRKHQ
jgi:hypothetical protein